MSTTRAKDFELVHGILSVVLSLLSSVYQNLSDKIAEFITGQISLEYLQKVFTVVSSFESGNAAVALPLLIETCALLTSIGELKYAKTFSPDTLMQNFERTVSLINADDDKNDQERYALIAVNATATAEMLCVLNSQVDLSDLFYVFLYITLNYTCM